MTRSDFLRNGLKSILGFTAELVDQQVESTARKMVIPQHRPPGAISEVAFLMKCTRCDLCREACPHGAITVAAATTGSAVGTPIIIPDTAPCHLCEDTPCISACPEGALLPVEKIKMGRAYVIQSKCFGYNGQVGMCDYCFDRCPLKNQAIVMENHKPRINAEHCAGCGLCEYFCPAPGKAIKVVVDRV